MLVSRISGATRLLVVLCLALAGAAVAVGAPAPAGALVAAAPAPVTVTFDATGAAQSWVVPAGVTSVDVVAKGSAGAVFGVNQGKGAVVTSTVTVTPGETLAVMVGDEGTSSGTGGWNGGGNGDGNPTYKGSGGGGATDLRRAPAGLEDRLVVAGAGGGSTEFKSGGNGGQDGTNGGGSGGGQRGMQTQGGNAGYSPPVTSGSLGTGGNGWDGGGGGAGYYGGGGGGFFGGGGGGGSSFGPTGTVYQAGANSGVGQLTITYTPPAPVPVASRTVWLSTPNPSKSGGTILYARVMPLVPGGAVPTGTVTFSDGDGRTNEATLNAYGQAVWYDTALKVGSYTVGATYNGSDTYNPSTAPSRTQTVEQAATAVTWLSNASTPNPSVKGSTVLYARVNAVAPGRGTVTTGSIRFDDGDGHTYDAPVNAYGQGVWYDTALGAGEHTVTATYLGSTEFAASPTASRTHTVNKADTTTKIQTQTKANGDTIVYATVRPVAPGRGIPGGTVTFTDANGATTNATLSQYGIASIVLTPSQTPLARADYHGSADFNASAYAAPSTIDQSNPGPTVTAYNVGTSSTISYTVSQTFVAGRSGSMDKISIQASWSAEPGSPVPADVEVAIRALDEAGLPTGAVLATGLLKAEQFGGGTGPATVDIVLSTPVAVLEDAGYVMTFTATAESDVSFVLSASGDQYADGEATQTVHFEGDLYPFPAGDLIFATWVRPAPAPAPTARA